MTTTINRKTALLIALSTALTLTACGDNEPAATTDTPLASIGERGTVQSDTTTPDAAAIANAGNDATEWLTYGRDYAETRFSPLNQINSNNVSELGVAWTYDTGEVRGHEATPLVHNGVM